MNLLILGATGFLGSNLLKQVSRNRNFIVYGTSCSHHEESCFIHVDVTNTQSLQKTIIEINPDVVV